MKEAAGEANITVITIVLIALVLAVGTPLISSILKRMSIRACCTSAGGEITTEWNSYSCALKDANGNKTLLPREKFWDDTNNKCKY